MEECTKQLQNHIDECPSCRTWYNSKIKEAINDVTLEDFKLCCNICGHKWNPVKVAEPKRCPNPSCRSWKWK